MIAPRVDAPADARTEPADVDLVMPTVGRPSLVTLLESIAVCDGPPPGRIVVVDDREDPADPDLADTVSRLPAPLQGRIEVVHSGGRGPAAARNLGWRGTRARWVAFVDDDVVVPPTWLDDLRRDLHGTAADVGGSQGRIRVPLPDDRPPTDWERNVAGLEQARWATADMAYRRDVLDQVGGFDERFPRAYREDADLGLRVTRAGYRIVVGERHIVHPVRPADGRVSLRVQAGNADDPFMAALHGRRWRASAGVPRGRRPWHLATVATALVATVATVLRRRRVAVTAAAAWAGLTSDFAWRRIAPGPRTRDEVTRMVGTSVLLPFAATWHWLRGLVTLPARLRRPAQRPTSGAGAAATVVPRSERLPAAVLFDRDGTLVHDVPYNGDPERVRLMEGAEAALVRLRELGIPVAVVSNQSGVGRGFVTAAQVDAVNQRIERLLGPLGTWEICPHAPEDRCVCRKPSPTLIERACSRLGVDPADCVVIGDIGADVDAALAAGARPVLVPTAATRHEEVALAPTVARDLGEAVELALRPPALEGGVA